MKKNLLCHILGCLAVILLALPALNCCAGLPAGGIPNDQNTEGYDKSMKTDLSETGGDIPSFADPYLPLNYTDFKAMWLSQFDLQSVYVEGGVQRPEASFTKYIKTIVANIKDQGFNTVIVQTRPYADSMYPSEYYPMSYVAVGSYGRGADYDPFAIIIKEAHEAGLSFHAWINPIRAMTDSQIGAVGDKYAVKQWYSDTSKRGKYLVHSGNYWYLNPAYPEVRRLIVDGAREILEKYDVDGLHMDDYFYPTTDASFDAAAYSDYVKSGGGSGLAEWRREQFNILVKDLYDAVKEYSADALFGISPSGNFNTAYNDHCADIYKWCGEAGYVDYICPQIYFGFEHATCDFAKVASAYQNMIAPGSGVRLIIGMTLGKALDGYNGKIDKYAGGGKEEWIEKRDVLYRELSHTTGLDKCTGVAYFCYQFFFDPLSGTTIKETSDERSLLVPLLRSITWIK